MKKRFMITFVLLVFAAVMAAGKKPVVIKRDTGRGTVPQAVWSKLLGLLQDAIKVYRKQPKLGKDAAGFQAVKKGPRFNRPVLAEALVDPKLQRRWKNPPYDVLTCLIKTSGKTGALADYNLKICSVSDLGKEKILSVEMSALDLEKVAALPAGAGLKLNMPGWRPMPILSR